MNSAVQAISWQGLILAMVPTFIVLAIMWRWTAGVGTGVYATIRMLVQLLLIGYVLVFIFETGEPTVVLAILGAMLLVASWISIRPLAHKSRRLYQNALISISLSGVLTLALVSQSVIGVDPWFSPRYLIPLAGMIFAGAMNTISLAAERAWAEAGRGIHYRETRRIALQAALIPMINSLFAVGLVSLPGMMTGQILSGTSPLVAAKYQIVVMSMLFGVSGMSAAIFLHLERGELEQLSVPAE
ncbi:MAG: ABC transporter permease [Gammaproteobacteria bacterium]|jgi:putative ABC transport system permease protein|nr:ABC transporter permease [Gammaproteobacteria bacterium]